MCRKQAEHRKQANRPQRTKYRRGEDKKSAPLFSYGQLFCESTRDCVQKASPKNTCQRDPCSDNLEFPTTQIPIPQGFCLASPCTRFPPTKDIPCAYSSLSSLFLPCLSSPSGQARRKASKRKNTRQAGLWTSSMPRKPMPWATQALERLLASWIPPCVSRIPNLQARRTR